MDFSWLRIPRPSWSHPQEIGEREEDGNSPTLPYEDGRPVVNFELERQDDNVTVSGDVSVDDEVDRMRENLRDIMRKWYRLNPYSWEREVQSMADSVQLGQGYQDRHTVGETGVLREVAGVPVENFETGMTNLGQGVQNVGAESLVAGPRVTDGQNLNVACGERQPEVGYGASYQPTVHGEPGFGQTARLYGTEVSRASSMLTVTRPTTTMTYTLIAPQMSTLTSNRVDWFDSGSPMVEEKSLYGRVWVPISHSTPMVHNPQAQLQFGSHSPPEQNTYQDSWRLVSEDRSPAVRAQESQANVGWRNDDRRAQMAPRYEGFADVHERRVREPQTVSYQPGLNGGRRTGVPGGRPGLDDSQRTSFPGGRHRFSDVPRTGEVPPGTVPKLLATENRAELPPVGVSFPPVSASFPSEVETNPVGASYPGVTTSVSCAADDGVTADGGTELTSGGGNRGNRSTQIPLSKAKRVAKYDGKSSWSDYLVQFEIATQLNGWDESQKAMELATSLEGVARGVLADVSPEHRLNYKILVEKLMQRFEPDGQLAIYQSQLQHRRRRSNKTIPELAQEISRIARKAYQ